MLEKAGIVVSNKMELTESLFDVAKENDASVCTTATDENVSLNAIPNDACHLTRMFPICGTVNR